MAKRRPYDIVKYPANVLSSVAEDVFYSEEYFKQQRIRFKRACDLNQGCGVAAPQLGIPSRFFYLDYQGEKFLAINPEITHYSDEWVTAVEGCLSVPGKEFRVERSEWIHWEYTNEGGDRISERVDGFKARIIQHEYDHLQGLCLPDLALDSNYAVKEVH